jgi:creatinine amidohydrolase/Fe(II)-dependent formamide hydrolase-like protein
MLAALPALVGNTGAAFEPILREGDPFRQPDMGASGVLGDPSTASAAAGEKFLDTACRGLAELLDAFHTPGHTPDDEEQRP